MPTNKKSAVTNEYMPPTQKRVTRAQAKALSVSPPELQSRTSKETADPSSPPRRLRRGKTPDIDVAETNIATNSQGTPIKRMAVRLRQVKSPISETKSPDPLTPLRRSRRLSSGYEESPYQALLTPMRKPRLARRHSNISPLPEIEESAKQEEGNAELLYETVAELAQEESIKEHQKKPVKSQQAKSIMPEPKESVKLQPEERVEPQKEKLTSGNVLENDSVTAEISESIQANGNVGRKSDTDIENDADRIDNTSESFTNILGSIENKNVVKSPTPPHKRTNEPEFGSPIKENASTFPKSWSLPIKINAKSNSASKDTPANFIDRISVKDATPKKSISPSPKLAQKSPKKVDSEQERETDDDESDSEIENKNEFLDDEAIEVSDDEDSLDSSEREYLKNNEITEKGESIGSEDTDEEKEEDDDEMGAGNGDLGSDLESFLVTDSEPDKLSGKDSLIGSDDEVTGNKYRRIRKMSSSSDDELDTTFNIEESHVNSEKVNDPNASVFIVNDFEETTCEVKQPDSNVSMGSNDSKREPVAEKIDENHNNTPKRKKSESASKNTSLIRDSKEAECQSVAEPKTDLETSKKEIQLNLSTVASLNDSRKSHSRRMSVHGINQIVDSEQSDDSSEEQVMEGLTANQLSNSLKIAEEDHEKLPKRKSRSVRNDSSAEFTLKMAVHEQAELERNTSEANEPQQIAADLEAEEGNNRNTSEESVSQQIAVDLEAEEGNVLKTKLIDEPANCENSLKNIQSTTEYEDENNDEPMDLDKTHGSLTGITEIAVSSDHEVTPMELDTSISPPLTVLSQSFKKKINTSKMQHSSEELTNNEQAAPKHNSPGLKAACPQSCDNGLSADNQSVKEVASNESEDGEWTSVTSSTQSLGEISPKHFKKIHKALLASKHLLSEMKSKQEKSKKKKKKEAAVENEISETVSLAEVESKNTEEDVMALKKKKKKKKEKQKKVKEILHMEKNVKIKEKVPIVKPSICTSRGDENLSAYAAYSVLISKKKKARELIEQREELHGLEKENETEAHEFAGHHKKKDSNKPEFTSELKKKAKTFKKHIEIDRTSETPRDSESDIVPTVKPKKSKKKNKEKKHQVKTITSELTTTDSDTPQPEPQKKSKKKVDLAYDMLSEHSQKKKKLKKQHPTISPAETQFEKLRKHEIEEECRASSNRKMKKQTVPSSETNSSSEEYVKPSKPAKSEKKKLKIIEKGLPVSFNEEPASPKVVKGFKVSDSTPKSIGAKVRSILSVGQTNIPSKSETDKKIKKHKKQKQRHGSSDENSSPKQVWSSTGWWQISEAGPMPQLVSKEYQPKSYGASTQFVVKSLNDDVTGDSSSANSRKRKASQNLDCLAASSSSTTAYEFKRKAMFSDKVQRESSKEILQKKIKRKF